MLSTTVAVEFPRQDPSAFGAGLNTIAVRKGLVGIRKTYAGNMEIFGDGEPVEAV
jgi:hypothetical protein